MDEYAAYYLDFNGYIDETGLDYQLEGLTLGQAVNTAEEIIVQSGTAFCTCTILDGWTDNDDNVRGWVEFNNASDDAPHWKEAQ